MIGRAPDFRVAQYLYRWHLFPLVGRWSWIDRHVGNVYLHRFRDSDLPIAHDHPYGNLSLILAGRYLEHWHDGTATMRRPGAVVFRGSRVLHWLEVIDGPVWTVFIHGPRRRTWGFMTREGWIDHKTHLEDRGR